MSITEAQETVAEFHIKFGVPLHRIPGIRRPLLRASLIREESKEVTDAIDAGDIVETADGLCDLIYVCLGAALEFGIDLGPIFDEVHQTNMAKEGGPTRSDGKILKPEGWEPPQIRELLERQGYAAPKED
jgi:predicted HAD superfamily Cof-like phosphohydrolase